MTSWQKLEAVVVEQFNGRPDLQARARDAIAWLVAHSLDRAERIEHAARVGIGREFNR
jgi:hypothetical protein